MSDVTGADEAEGFLAQVKHALADLAEVKVVTLVGKVRVTITTEGDSTTTRLETTEVSDTAMVTVVKVLDGDVTTVIAESLLANSELRALHTAQVTASLAVLPANLKALVDIAKSLRDL